MNESNVKLGKYRHFKGSEYEVVGIAKNSETLEDMVIYKELYGQGCLWVRPVSMFVDFKEAEGKTVPRFKFLE